MDSDYSDDELAHSDAELDDDAHKKLMGNVLNLTYKQHVKKSTRTEPTLKISEFDLVKTGKNVHVADLASVLQRRGKQQQIGAQLKRAEQKLATLPKPLEKPAAERIHRAVAYKKTQNELARWDPIVASIRSSTHTTFPLHADSKLDEKVETKADWGYKTKLQKELAAVVPTEEVFVMGDEDDFPMTMEEMMEKRREAAKMRAHESYKIAKARRQNKIKSKKFHRVQKKEKMRQQMKEFELLQKTNPEAALEKLEEIERARAEERMSLRHKSTGQWAKSKLVRAKYDKESRQVLAQQLSISRDLTQKLKKGEDDSEGEDETADETKLKSNPDNPWLNGAIKVSKEVDDFVSGYRKYWEQQNGTEPTDTKSTERNEVIHENIPAADSDSADDENIGDFTKALEVTKGNIATKRKAVEKVTPSISKNAKQVKITRTRVESTSEWDVSAAHDSHNISLDFDQEFNKIDSKLRKKVDQKLKSLKSDTSKTKLTKANNLRKSECEKPTQLELLALPKANLRPVIDEELDETAHRRKKQENEILQAFNLLNSTSSDEAKVKPQREEIDPNKFINMKTTKLNSAIPDLLAFDDNEETDQRGVISEAFQDDDVVDTFQKEKQSDIDANNPKSIDLSLPGWGAWGGKDIKMHARKKKRFIMKFPEKQKRKDCNKGNLILNENANGKVREHLVSEVPFPFKNVKDYEASIRAPIGSTFVPETAFRRLTKPAVTTKLGTVIEPMNDEILVKRKK